MKKQINSVSNWSVKGIITVAILSAMLCTLGANANNKPAVPSAVTMKVESENAAESLMNSNAESNNEYKAEDFVNAEMALETESWKNIDAESNTEAVDEYSAKEFVQADMVNEIYRWMNSNSESNNESIEEYNAEKFVQADMANEFESWLKNSSF